MSANNTYHVFVTGPGNMMLPFAVVMYKATCKVRCQTYLVIPCQGVHIWMRLAWNACEAAAALAAEPHTDITESLYLHAVSYRV